VRDFEGSVWQGVALGAAAYFIALRLPFSWLLGPLALGWAGWRFVTVGRPRLAGWAWGAAGGAGAAGGGALVNLILDVVLSLLHPASLPYTLLAVLAGLFRLALGAIPLGAVCGGVGGALARRPGPGRRRDHR
jgi:hypothetical protein